MLSWELSAITFLFLNLRSVWIEKESINSVVVNDAPEETHQRMFVAASLSVNATGNWITLFLPSFIEAKKINFNGQI